jgi:hypothetical protein
LLAVVFVCIAGMVGAAERGPSPDRISEAIDVCVRQGWLEGAVRAAKLANIPLTAGELNAIVDVRVHQGDLDGAVAAAKLIKRSLTVDELDTIVRVRIQRILPGDPIEAVRLGASSEQIEVLVGVYVKRGDLTRALEAAKLRPMGRRSLTTDEVNEIVDACVGQGWLSGAIRAAKLGTTIDRIHNLVRACVQNGYLGYAIEAAQLAGRSLIPDELNEIVSVDVHRGWFKDAIEAAKFAGRTLTVDEVNEIVDIYIHRKQFAAAVVAAKLGTSSDRISVIQNGCLHDEQIDCFIEATKLLP